MKEMENIHKTLKDTHERLERRRYKTDKEKVIVAVDVEKAVKKLNELSETLDSLIDEARNIKNTSEILYNPLIDMIRLTKEILSMKKSDEEFMGL